MRLLVIALAVLGGTSLAAASQSSPVLSDAPRRVAPPYVPEHQTYAQAAIYPRNASGDIDGDGDLDASLEGHILVNNGDGVFAPSACMPVVATSLARSSALADLDGDGDTDLIRRGGTELELWVNTGGGCFNYVPGQFTASYTYFDRFAVADLDADGDVDVFVPSFHDLNAEPSKLFLNSGAATFTDSLQPVLGWLFDHSDVALADIDGDGDIDVFAYGDQSPNDCCGGGYESLNRVLLNDGHAQFTLLTTPLPAPYGRPKLADVDSDGDLDLWLDSATLFVNDGAQNFSDASGGLPDLGAVYQLSATGDLDGDGDLDALVDAERDSRTLVNDGTGVFAALDGRWPGSLPEGELVDVDGDGDLDFFHGDSVLFNRGDGRMVAPPTTLPPRPLAAFKSASADLDGDLDRDLLVLSGPVDGAQSPFLRRLRNLGNGAFEELPPSIAPNHFVQDFALADLDGDGDEDVVTDPIDVPVRVFTNDGSGNFAQGAPVVASSNPDTRRVVCGDLDGDGDADVISAGPVTWVWINDGFASLVQAAGHWPSAYAGDHVALGDLDLDGDLDAVAGRAPGGGVSVLLNDGAATFALHEVTLVATAFELENPLLGDVDGDGDLDLATSTRLWYWPNSSLHLALNDGTGHFASAPLAPAIAGSHKLAGLVDFDRDGDLDLIAASEHGLRQLANDGAGVFSDAGAIAVDIETAFTLFEFTDLDFDGDVDAVCAGYPLLRVLSSVTRHLAWRTPPRVGHVLELELHGPPHEHFQLYASLGAAHLPFGAAGTLLIDRSQLVMTASGVFDAAGRALAARDVPSDPAYIGLTLYWQALVANPRRLTNLEITRIESY